MHESPTPYPHPPRTTLPALVRELPRSPPQAVVHTDGTILLYTIGMEPQGAPRNCKKGLQLGAAAHGAELIELHYSASPYGPWTQLIVPGASYGGRNLFNGTNPSPWVLPNGTVVVASHGASVVASTTGAHDWRGPYAPPEPLFAPPGVIKFEDPFLWFDSGADVWRALLHQYNGSAPHPQFRVGGYAQSRGAELFGAWDVQSEATPAYTTLVPFAGGSARNYTRRERPKLLLDASGAPTVLYSGVCEGTSQGANCYTLGAAVGA
jgi:hypothetical protein